MLTPSQQQAFEKITRSQKKHGKFLLLGYAGTGKTFLMNEVASHFVAQGSAVAVTAPTHKATSVLKEKVTHSDVACLTIHSLLRLVPIEGEDGKTTLQRSVSFDASDNFPDVVIIDECSMLSVELMEWITKLLSNAYVIFVGDDAQLPPVGEERSLSFDISKRFVLSEIVRQKQGNPILEAAQKCREYQKESTQKWDFLKPQKVDRTGIFHAGDTDTWMRKAFSSEAFDNNPNAFRYLAWTNLKVASMNKKVQRWLFGNIDTPFAIGELVISKKRYICDDGQEVQNSQEMKVTGIDEKTYTTRWKRYASDHDFEIPIWVIRCDNGAVIRTIKDQKKYKEAYDYIRKNHKFMVPLDGKRTYDHVTGFKEKFGLLAANYAMTVHTSQGSTFRCAFIDVADIRKREKTNLLEAQQLMYVAMTRTTDMVFIV